VERAHVQVGEQDDGDDRRRARAGERAHLRALHRPVDATASSAAMQRQAIGISRSGTRG
jgi:hypothetical protein